MPARETFSRRHVKNEAGLENWSLKQSRTDVLVEVEEKDWVGRLDPGKTGL